ncbi:MAG: ASKHA domain-containing protein [Pseudomonadota bacterium]
MDEIAGKNNQAAKTDGIDKPKNINIVFTPSGKKAVIPAGLSILETARQLGVDLDSVCGGRGICGRCQIEPSLGHFPKFSIHAKKEHLSPFSKIEERYKSKRSMPDTHRLGCSTKLLGDMVIDIPAQSQLHQQIIRKRAENREIKINPLIRLFYLEVEQPDMDHPSGDLERVFQALSSQWNISISHIEHHLLSNLQTILRDSNWNITVAVRHEKNIIAIWPGFKDHILGVAIDVGSTTISAHLCNLRDGEVLASNGVMNPQIRFGEDLMSRVSYVMLNQNNAGQLTQTIRQSLNDLIEQVCIEADCNIADVLEIVLVANPVMHHILMGWSPVELGWAPFALVSNAAQDIPAQKLDFDKLNLGAHIWLLPLIAGHVGADAAAVILSEAPQLSNKITLIVDIGTNAEIILGNKDQLLACSSPTGPALEGAQISCGQRAAAGAIERVRIDPKTLKAHFQIIGCPLWSNEDGFAEQTLKTPVSGICGSGIIEVLAEMFLTGILDMDGRIQPQKDKPSPYIVENDRTCSYILYDHGDHPIMITQNDVRAVQLAKAALYAGAQLLIDKLQKTPERIILAGAFGSHIDTKYAMILGLIPDCALSQVSSVGNAAGTGARIALLDKQSRNDIVQTVRRIEKIETATKPRFQEHFVEAMAIPHKTAPFAKLRQETYLPPIEQKQQNTKAASKRRRNRRHKA